MGEIIQFLSRKEWEQMKQLKMLETWEEYLQSERDKMAKYMERNCE